MELNKTTLLIAGGAVASTALIGGAMKYFRGRKAAKAVIGVEASTAGPATSNTLTVAEMAEGVANTIATDIDRARNLFDAYGLDKVTTWEQFLVANASK